MEPIRRRQKLIVLLTVNITLQLMLGRVIQQHQAALVIITNCMCAMKLLFSRARLIQLEPHSVWRLDRNSPWKDSTLLASQGETEFRRRCRVNRSTFMFICSLVAEDLQGRRGHGIPLQTAVALSLNRLGTGNYLLACGDLFGVSEGQVSVIVRDFCRAVLKAIRPLVVPKFSETALPTLAAEFEKKHGIPYIMGAIDGSHIPINAPSNDPAPFYNRKGFYLVLLQGTVDMQTVFWDWDFRWAGSLHDYTLFSNSTEGRKVMNGFYKPYKLIGDAAYPARMCMYVPFTGSKENLEAYKAYWNFIQSSTRMCVERAFGILKGRWRILLRRNEMKLENVADVVGACICLHNLCIMHKDFVDDTLVKEALVELHKCHIGEFSDLRTAGTMSILDYGKSEVGRVNVDVEELIRQASLAGADDHPMLNELNPSTVSALKAGVIMHTELAKNLFNHNLHETVPLDTDCIVNEDLSSDDEGQISL